MDINNEKAREISRTRAQVERRKERDSGGQAHTALTLRDHFATQAMQALVPTLTGMGAAKLDAMAGDAYKVADAMMRERSNGS